MTHNVDYTRYVKPEKGVPDVKNSRNSTTLEAAFGGEVLDQIQKYANNLYAGIPVQNLREIKQEIIYSLRSFSADLQLAARISLGWVDESHEKQKRIVPNTFFGDGAPAVA